MSKILCGFEKGMGIGGWLTNFKRVSTLPEALRYEITVGDLEHFASYITEKDVINIKSMGFDYVRFPFDQLILEEYDKPFCYREEGFSHLTDFIGWCEKHGLNVMLNCHKAIGCYCDSDVKVSLFDDELLQKRFISMWEEIERRYHDKGFVAFEILNEATTTNDTAWNNVAQKTLEALRQLNKNRLIVIGCAEWNRLLHLPKLRLYDDPNVAYTFHFYDPDIFTHQRGVMRPNYAFYNREIHYPDDITKLTEYAHRFHEREFLYEGLDRFDERFIEKNFCALLDDFIEKHPNVNLYFGEFGTIRHVDIMSRENWMRDLISAVKKRGISYSVWNYLSTPYDGNRFSLVDDDTRLVLSQRLGRILVGKE